MTHEIIPTNQPPSSPSVNDVEFLTYENSTFGIKMTEHRALSILAVENNTLYRIRYQPLGTTSYYDNIPITREWIKKTIIFLQERI